MSYRSRFLIIWALLFMVVGMQSIGVPRGAGPDEPAHLVRAAALVRGDPLGSPGGDDLANRFFDAPEWAGQPSPGCYVFRPEQAVSCAVYSDSPAMSTAGSYPIFGHILPGLATLLPGGADTAWLSRLLDALLPTLLVAWAMSRLVEASEPLQVAAVALSLTPMALFSMAVVNPSGLVIGGAVALWVASDRIARGDSSWRWLFTAAWAAVVLPRTDGLIWVFMITLLASFGAAKRPSAMWKTLGRGALATIIAMTAGAALWVVAVRPALIDAPAPFSGWALAREIFGRTGVHLTEAIGVLGWLDTEIPTSALLLWTAMLGALAGAVLLVGERRRAIAAVVTLVLAIVVSWALDYLQAPSAGLFWQGRYGLPLLVGVVIQVGYVERSSKTNQSQLSAVILTGCWIVWNLAVLQALRRWGVGASGSMLPWDWDAWSTVLPLEVIILLHAGASGALMVAVGAWSANATESQPRGQPDGPTATVEI